MKIDRFQMERTQCLYENEVDFNLSESGVLPLSLGELVPDPAQRAALDAELLRYPHYRRTVEGVWPPPACGQAGSSRRRS